MKVWIQAFRLRTLPLAFSCILMGAFIAAGEDKFSGVILGLSLLTTLFLQILSNLANDYGDATSGVDGAQREGPSRTVSSGLISKSAMKSALVIFSILSLISGVILIILAFGDQWKVVIIFLTLGIGAIAAAIKYTIGSNPYGYAGWGDLFVLIFFGFVGVVGSYYLHTHSFDLLVLLPGYSCGVFAVGVLNVNNIRDIESDRISGKQSIPVRVGREKAIYYHWFLLFSGWASILIYAVINAEDWKDYLFLLTIPLFYINARAVKLKTKTEQLDPYLKQLALSTLIFVLIYGIGMLF